MDSVHQGLRDGDIEKDTYDRLRCASCKVGLGKKQAEEGYGYIHTCPDCGRAWRRIG